MASAVSLTVLVPALNEEANLATVVREAAPVVERFFPDYEILVVDDGSTDRTGAIADDLARENPRVRVIHNGSPRGLGYNYRLGAEQGTKDLYVWIPGDNENPATMLEPVFERTGQADMVIPYVVNPEVRPVGRRLLSRAFTAGLNLLFFRRVPYYNGPVLHRRALLAGLRPWTPSFAFQAEIVLQLLGRGVTYVAAPIRIRRVEGSVTKAFKPRNVALVLGTVFRLFWRLQVAGRLSPSVATKPAESLSRNLSSNGS